MPVLSRFLSSSTTSNPDLHGYFSLSQRILRLPDRVINKYRKYNRTFRESNRKLWLVLFFAS